MNFLNIRTFVLLVACPVVAISQYESEYDYQDTDGRTYAADRFVELFAQRMKMNSSEEKIVRVPDFKRGRLTAYNADGLYLARRDASNDVTEEDITCGSLIPESFDFKHCDYKDRSAVMRKRYAVPSAYSNDCTLRESDVRLENTSSNPLLQAWHINCDCDDKSLLKSSDSDKHKLVINARPSQSGKDCLASFAHRSIIQESTVNSTFAHVLGCNFHTGKVDLLPITSDLQQSRIMSVDSDLCQCDSEGRRLKSLMFSSCGGSSNSSYSKHPTDATKCSTDSNYTCSINLPRFLKMGTCNYSTGRSDDEAIFLSYDPQTGNLTEKRAFVHTSSRDCECSNYIFSRKFDNCMYGQGKAKFTVYRGMASVNGSTCVIRNETDWVASKECNCATGYRYLAPPLCHTMQNNRSVTHSWRVHESNSYCSNAQSGASADSALMSQVESADQPNEHPVYDQSALLRLRNSHASLKSLLHDLFGDELSSTCECSKAVFRVPLGCTRYYNGWDSSYNYKMRFLTLTRRRATFFCTVDKKTEYLPVNPRYCSDD